jgi:hypothetical protein
MGQNQDQAGGQRSRKENPGITDRRKFMRQIGMGGVLTAALVGATEVTGLSPALAASNRQQPDIHKGKTIREIRSRPAGDLQGGQTHCVCTPGHCGTGCPTGYWCHSCGPIGANNIPILSSRAHYCMGGGCSSHIF